MQSLLILGRQPELSLAELESLYGAAKLRPLAANAVAVDVDPCLLAFDRLGGAVKFAKVLVELATTDWNEIAAFLIEAGPTHAQSMPAGKMYLGISAYGFKRTPKEVMRLAIALKNAVHQTGRGVRVIPNNSLELTSAQVIHGRLTRPNGWELLLIRSGTQTVIAQTVKVQDIAAYTARDRNRPARDPKVGMLPPKLAQIIINLSSGKLPPESMQSVCEIPPEEPIPKAHYQDKLLLDPFCGSGVIIQEAAIMGYDCMGTDIDQRMVDYAKANLQWLSRLARSPLNPEVKLGFERADATSYRWPLKPTFVASETYLGPPFSAKPAEGELKATIAECERITRAFMANIASQLDKGARLCLAVPAWRLKNGGIKHLPLLDSLEVIGYNRLSFQHARGSDDLLYYRTDQVVARELLVLTKS